MIFVIGGGMMGLAPRLHADTDRDDEDHDGNDLVRSAEPSLREPVEPPGRDAEPSAGIIDSQSVKGADTLGPDSRGYDAGKKVNGRKRFIVTDALGLLITVTACVVLGLAFIDRTSRR